MGRWCRSGRSSSCGRLRGGTWCHVAPALPLPQRLGEGQPPQAEDHARSAPRLAVAEQEGTPHVGRQPEADGRFVAPQDLLVRAGSQLLQQAPVLPGAPGFEALPGALDRTVRPAWCVGAPSRPLTVPPPEIPRVRRGKDSGPLSPRQRAIPTLCPTVVRGGGPVRIYSGKAPGRRRYRGWIPGSFFRG